MPSLFLILVIAQVYHPGRTLRCGVHQQTDNRHHAEASKEAIIHPIVQSAHDPKGGSATAWPGFFGLVCVAAGVFDQGLAYKGNPPPRAAAKTWVGGTRMRRGTILPERTRRLDKGPAFWHSCVFSSSCQSVSCRCKLSQTLAKMAVPQWWWGKGGQGTGQGIIHRQIEVDGSLSDGYVSSRG
jgi:hypothetical protein